MGMVEESSSASGAHAQNAEFCQKRQQHELHLAIMRATNAFKRVPFRP